MVNASEILNSLDAAEIRQRLEDLDKERQALLILHRAAIRVERKTHVKQATKEQGGQQ